MLFLQSTGLLAGLGAVLVAVGLRSLGAMSLQPVEDLHRVGLYASLWAYGVALMRSSPPAPSASPYAAASQPSAVASQDSAERPNVVLVQSESFFDPRLWCPEVAPTLLQHFDATFTEAVEKGELSVPAWGANTVRTECAVLTGLAPSAWGARQFNPYRTLSRHPLPSVASAFRAQGYRTICVHPYPRYLLHAR